MPRNLNFISKSEEQQIISMSWSKWDFRKITLAARQKMNWNGGSGRLKIVRLIRKLQSQFRKKWWVLHIGQWDCVFTDKVKNLGGRIERTWWLLGRGNERQCGVLEARSNEATPGKVSMSQDEAKCSYLSSAVDIIRVPLIALHECHMGEVLHWVGKSQEDLALLWNRKSISDMVHYGHLGPLSQLLYQVFHKCFTLLLLLLSGNTHLYLYITAFSKCSLIPILLFID